VSRHPPRASSARLGLSAPWTARATRRNTGRRDRNARNEAARGLGIETRLAFGTALDLFFSRLSFRRFARTCAVFLNFSLIFHDRRR
jgi:hypothetical protein